MDTGKIWTTTWTIDSMSGFFDEDSKYEDLLSLNESNAKTPPTNTKNLEISVVYDKYVDFVHKLSYYICHVKNHSLYLPKILFKMFDFFEFLIFTT